MIEVVICTHNPRRDNLSATLQALREQTLRYSDWRLTVIDNASLDPLTVDKLGGGWQPHFRVIREEQLGLTHARLRAIAECEGEIIVWSDDDNLLAPDYLIVAVEFMKSHPHVGLAGGRSLPQYEETPAGWYTPDLAPLGCRDLGAERIWTTATAEPDCYPHAAPIGAGMIARRAALMPWVKNVQKDVRRLALGRTGKALTSGEDNDINLTALRHGWDLAYVPELSLIHLIPPGRLTLEYQQRLARASFRDFVTVLDLHGIRPWPPIPRWTIWPRAWKSWVTMKAWRYPANRVRWAGVLGQYEGRARLTRSRCSPSHFLESNVQK